MNYSQIRSMDISNGEDVGVALFTQGCNFHCKNCFNSDTWDFNGGTKWTEETKGKFLNLIDRDYIKRVSFLGGECLADENVSDIYNLVQEVRKRFPEKKIWMHTGYVYEDIIKESYAAQFLIDSNDQDRIYLTDKDKCRIFRRKVVNKIDVLVDGRYVHELRDQKLKFRGSSNQRVIDVQKTLDTGSVVLYLE